MRALGVIVLVGCGRLGFDPSADARVAPCTGPDEDSDGFPDACDNCPSEPNADQRDELEVVAGVTADGVGDACDPRPAASGDRVFLFDPFAARDDVRFTYYEAVEYPGTGVLRLGSLGNAQEGQAFFAIPLTVTRIDTAFEVVEYSTTEVQWAGVWSDISSNGEQKIFNEAAFDPSDGVTRVRIKETAGGTDRYSADIIDVGPWRSGSRYRMLADTVDVTGGGYQLQLSIDGGAFRSTMVDVGIPRGAEAFLEAQWMVCDFAYVTVYAR